MKITKSSLLDILEVGTFVALTILLIRSNHQLNEAQKFQRDLEALCLTASSQQLNVTVEYRDDDSTKREKIGDICRRAVTDYIARRQQYRAK